VKKILFILIFIVSSSVLADSKMDLGLDVFKNKAECGTCHTLKAANTNGEIGPNLDRLNLQESQIISAVRNGIGVMPPWEGILTYEEIEAVAYYIFNSASK